MPLVPPPPLQSAGIVTSTIPTVLPRKTRLKNYIPVSIVWNLVSNSLRRNRVPTDQYPFWILNVFHNRTVPGRFLDTKCVPQPDGSIRTVVYRKPTHTDLYVQWISNHPLSAKLSAVSSLFYRASVVCRNPDDLKAEQDYLTKVLSYNGYPSWAINKGRERLDKIHVIPYNSSDKSTKRKSYVVMNYITGLSERIRDIL